MPTVYTVKEAADLLSVSVSTLRRIADESAAYLPDYRPISGQPRTFTDSDLRTVYAILSRLQARPGLTRSALLSELSAPGSEPLIIPATPPPKARPCATAGPCVFAFRVFRCAYEDATSVLSPSKDSVDSFRLTPGAGRTPTIRAPQ